MTGSSAIEFLRLRWPIVRLCVFWSCLLVLGFHIPVATSLSTAIDLFSRQQLATMSIFSAGFLSWTTVWALVQIYTIVTHRMMSKHSAAVPVVSPFEAKILVLTLPLAGFEWVNLLNNILPIYIGSPTSTGQLLVGVVSGLAGACILFFLGRCFNRAVPDFGFWILIACMALLGFGKSIGAEIEFLQTGALSRNLALFSVLLLLLNIVSANILVRKRVYNFAPSAPVIFAAVLLASVATPWVSVFVYVPLEPFLPGLVGLLPVILIQQAYLCITQLVEIVLVFILLWLFSAKSTTTLWRLDLAPFVLILLVSSGLNVILGGLPWSQVSPLTWLIVAWAAQKVLANYRKHCGPDIVHEKNDEDLFDADFRRGWRK